MFVPCIKLASTFCHFSSSHQQPLQLDVLQQWLRRSSTPPPAETVSLEVAGSPGSFVGLQTVKWSYRVKGVQVNPASLLMSCAGLHLCLCKSQQIPYHARSGQSVKQAEEHSIASLNSLQSSVPCRPMQLCRQARSKRTRPANSTLFCFGEGCHRKKVASHWSQCTAAASFWCQAYPAGRAALHQRMNVQVVSACNSLLCLASGRCSCTELPPI
jgi:hypothetical protein